MVNLILCSTISFFSLPYVYERGIGSTCRYGPCLGLCCCGSGGCRHDAVLVAVVLCMEARQAVVNPVIEALSGCGRGCSKASGLVVLVPVSLPPSRLQADAPTLPSRFFCPVFTSAGLGIRSLRACEHRTYARPPLD